MEPIFQVTPSNEAELPSDEDIRKLYEEKVKHILFTFNDKIIEIEEKVKEVRQKK